MAGGKLTPRQKMINMMYLVLTALLALNVSKEILDAFVVVNIGLLQQRDNLSTKNSNMYGAFDGQVVADPKNEKLKFLNDKALEVGALSKEVSDFVAAMKVELVQKVEGDDEDKAREKTEKPGLVEKKDDYDKPTHYFGTSNPPGEEGKAHDLKVKLEDYKTKLTALVDAVLDQYIKNPATKTLKRNDIIQRLELIDLRSPEETGDDEAKTWEMKYFYHLPLSAALTELTKWENIVKGAESEVLTFLWDQISATAFKFDAVEAKIIPKSNFVVSGGTFEAEIFLAAFSTSSRPKIVWGTGVDSTTGDVVGGLELAAEQIVDGKGLLSIPASGAGEKTIGGVIIITDPTGAEKKYPFNTIYNVSPPSATVAPTKMNVFYIGLDNPLSVSVPGIAPNNITVSSSIGGLSGSGGNYNIKPASGNACTITVSAKLADGRSQNMGQYQFRVKQVPDPVLQWNNATTGGGFAAQLGSQPVIPIMKDFDFEVYATISSMVIGFTDKDGNYKEYTMSSNVPSSECASGLSKVPKGRKVFVDAKVKKPGGAIANISGIWQIR